MLGAIEKITHATLTLRLPRCHYFHIRYFAVLLVLYSRFLSFAEAFFHELSASSSPPPLPPSSPSSFLPPPKRPAQDARRARVVPPAIPADGVPQIRRRSGKAGAGIAYASRRDSPMAVMRSNGAALRMACCARPACLRRYSAVRCCQRAEGSMSARIARRDAPRRGAPPDYVVVGRPACPCPPSQPSSAATFVVLLLMPMHAPASAFSMPPCLPISCEGGVENCPAATQIGKMAVRSMRQRGRTRAKRTVKRCPYLAVPGRLRSRYVGHEAQHEPYRADTACGNSSAALSAQMPGKQQPATRHTRCRRAASLQCVKPAFDAPAVRRRRRCSSRVQQKGKMSPAQISAHAPVRPAFAPP